MLLRSLSAYKSPAWLTGTSRFQRDFSFTNTQTKISWTAEQDWWAPLGGKCFHSACSQSSFCFYFISEYRKTYRGWDKVNEALQLILLCNLDQTWHSVCHFSLLDIYAMSMNWARAHTHTPKKRRRRGGNNPIWSTELAQQVSEAEASFSETHGEACDRLLLSAFSASCKLAPRSIVTCSFKWENCKHTCKNDCLCQILIRAPFSDPEASRVTHIVDSLSLTTADICHTGQKGSVTLRKERYYIQQGNFNIFFIQMACIHLGKWKQTLPLPAAWIHKHIMGDARLKRANSELESAIILQTSSKAGSYRSKQGNWIYIIKGRALDSEDQRRPGNVKLGWLKAPLVTAILLGT